MKYFLEIFRAPRDIHRVLLSGVLSLLLSHVIYLYESTAQNVSIVHTNDYIFLTVFWVVFCFCFLWCFLSSGFNLTLYIRIAIISAWSIALHRLFYGVEQAGTAFFNFVALMPTTLLIPYALAGMTPLEVFNKFGLFEKDLKNDNVIQYKRTGNDN